MAKIYKAVHPIVNPNTEINVPYNFPNKNPAIKAMGVANPGARSPSLLWSGTFHSADVYTRA